MTTKQRLLEIAASVAPALFTCLFSGGFMDQGTWDEALEETAKDAAKLAKLLFREIHGEDPDE